MHRILFLLPVLAAMATGAVAQDARQPEKATPPKSAAARRSVPENLTVKTYAYREGEFQRAWSMTVVYDHTDKSIRPGIVFVHGGGWKSGDKDRFLHYAIEYAQKGYVCVSTSYRLSHEAPFPAAVEDVKNAVRFFRAHASEYYLDPSRIGAFGNSAGAHLVSMLGLTKPEDGLEGDGTCLAMSSAVQAVTAAATPANFALFRQPTKEPANPFLAGPAESLPERIRKASPITYVRADAPPFLLVHGTADTTVDVAHADTFAEALKKAGARDVTYLRIDGAGHGAFEQNSADTHKAMDDFFERTLKKPAATAGR